MLAVDHSRLASAPASLAGRLDAVLPHLAPSLASDAARARLRRAASRAPAVSGFGFECRLGHPDRLDLAWRLTPGEQKGIALRGLALPPPVAGTTVCVEIDLPDSGGEGVGYFAGAGDAGRGRPSAGTAPHDVLALADWLGAGRLAPGARSFLSGRLAALPEHAWVGYVGRFAHRDADALRTSISGVRLGAVVAFLRDFGAPYRAVPKGLVESLDGLAVRLVIALDVRDGFGETVGIELSPRHPGDWQWCLRRLAPFGFAETCVPQLAAWPGLTRAAGETLARRLNHVKLACRAGQPTTTKAYFYIARTSAAECVAD